MLFAVAYASAGPRAAQRLRFTMADRSRGEASTSAPVQFKRGRAGKRRQRQQSPGDEGDAAAIKQAKPELKGAIQVSTARQAGQGLLDDAFTGTGEIQQHGDLGATRALESETLRGQDERSLKEAGMKAGEDEDGKYRGMSGYKDWRGVRVHPLAALLLPRRLSTTSAQFRSSLASKGCRRPHSAHIPRVITRCTLSVGTRTDTAKQCAAAQ